MFGPLFFYIARTHTHTNICIIYIYFYFFIIIIPPDVVWVAKILIVG